MKVIPPEDSTMVHSQQMMDAATQRLDWDQNHPIGVEDLVLGLEECENSHTLTTTTTGSKNSQKEANNQTDNQNSVLCPPKVPSLQSFCLG